MRFFLISLAIIAAVCAEGPSSDYLPPAEEHGASNVVESNFLESEPAHTLSDDGYRYRTVKRYRLRHRRDVNEISNDYLPPHSGSGGQASYTAPAQSYSVQESAPAAVYSAPAQASYSAPAQSYSIQESAPAAVYSAPAQASYSAPAQSYSVQESAPVASYESAASEPAHTLSNDGYRYRTVKRYRLRHRRDVNEISNDYLPPHSGSGGQASYSAPAQSYSVQESAPAAVYSAPAQASYSAPAQSYSFQESAPAAVYSAPAQASYSAPAQSYSVQESAPVASYESAASEPAHTLSNDGYRYRTVKRYRLRHRRDVNEISNDYLPPHSGSGGQASYSAPAQSYSVQESAPAAVYSAPAQASYSAPAQSYSFQESAPAAVYSAPAQASYSAPAQSYSVQESAPVASYESAASEPAHTLSNDGYRYRTVKRYRLRHRRDVNEISNDYLPPHSGSGGQASYSAPAQSYSVQESAPAAVYSAPAQASYSAPAQSYSFQESAPAAVYSAPAQASYSAPAQSYSVQESAPVASYESAASEPAHTLSNDGYRYRTVKRYRLRHRRDVNEISNDYLPPHSGSGGQASYSAPAQSYSVQESAPAAVYSAPAQASYSAPAQSYSFQESAPAAVYSAPAQASYSAPAQSYSIQESAPVASYESAASEPAHTLSDDGYRYKTVKRFRYRHRH